MQRNRYREDEREREKEREREIERARGKKGITKDDHNTQGRGRNPFVQAE
jgi:hypothetical protein